ncbi:alpha-ketoglutarate-dependent dioxygenase AlkB family protein [Kangiella taiwanensis]|uniref:Alpha-ketoglutarate-dependent dioxygenase AlkB n=1 Tax=Kangiella taiwanensis TaxID=1079179 RepID=A0ABP8I2T9_9GAMM|nr:alpha-ketoglutarate-dependent dioxygenase AlkB [Kangiella taiwanensis]
MQQIGLNLNQHIETFILASADEGKPASGVVQLHADFMDYDLSIELFDNLRKTVQWEQESLWIAGQERKVPRLVAWYGDSDADYRYSGKLHKPLPWIQPLLELRQRIEIVVGSDFNSVLCNLYRDGQDSMGWHADDEKELGAEPVIASLSLGQPRAFHLKHKTNPKLRHKMTLTSGSLLVMKGATQQHWLHQVPKEANITQPRINLTFRNVIGSSVK